MSKILILFGAAILLAAAYLVFFFKRILSFFGAESKPLIWGVSGALCVGFISAAVFNLFGFGLAVTLFLVLCGALTDLIYLIINKVTQKGKAWRQAYSSGIITFIITVLALACGIFNMNNVVKTEYDVKTDKNIKLKVAMISDLHLGTSIDSKELKEYCDEIESEDIDLLVLAGDLFDESSTKGEMLEAARVLGAVDTKYGIYFAYGNHDEGKYSGGRGYGRAEIERAFEANNIVILDDERVLVDESFYIIGRGDASIDPLSGKRAALDELLEGADKEKYILLIDHQPLELKEAAEAGVDIQFSGHTHAGQIWPLGLITEALGINEMNYGIRTIGSYTAIVSSGISGWGLPVRTAASSEYVIANIG